MILKNYIKIINNSTVLKIKVVTNSNKNEFFSIMDNWVFKIRITATPENWKANKELINFICWELSVKKNQVNLISWLTDKNKLVRVDF